MFNFTAREGTNTVATGTNDASGNITFTAINYTQAGKHVYVFSESAPSANGWTAKTSAITVYVEVTDDGEGHLTAAAYRDSNYTVAVTDGVYLTFENEYIEPTTIAPTTERQTAPPPPPSTNNPPTNPPTTTQTTTPSTTPTTEPPTNPPVTTPTVETPPETIIDTTIYVEPPEPGIVEPTESETEPYIEPETEPETVEEPEEVEEVEEIRIPLANGWFAVPLGDDMYEIFDENGIPLGVIHFEGDIWEWVDFDSLLPLIGFTPEPPKSNPPTGNTLPILIVMIAMAALGVGLVMRKKVKKFFIN
jgi:pilin isopeptide linkage protein